MKKDIKYMKNRSNKEKNYHHENNKKTDWIIKITTNIKKILKI